MQVAHGVVPSGRSHVNHPEEITATTTSADYCWCRCRCGAGAGAAGADCPKGRPCLPQTHLRCPATRRRACEGVTTTEWVSRGGADALLLPALALLLLLLLAKGSNKAPALEELAFPGGMAESAKGRIDWTADARYL